MFLPKGEVLETSLPGTHSIGVRRPLGVVASFTPWNGANVLSWRAVISPVAAGNTVVVKPSEFAPVSAGVMLAEVAEEAEEVGSDARLRERLGQSFKHHSGYEVQVSSASESVVAVCDRVEH